MKRILTRYQVAVYFVLSLLIPISGLIVVILGGLAKGSFSERAAEVVAKYGPSLAGMIVALLCGGIAGLIGLLKRFVVWRIDLRWYLLALLLPLVIDDLLPLAVSRLTGSTYEITWTYSYSTAYLFIPVLLQYFFLGGGMGEEFGWRGYLTSHLQQHRRALATSLIVGILWAMWHFPTFWFGHHAGVDLAYVHVEKLVRACALAVVFTWVFNNTRGSVLVAALMHAATNAWGHTYDIANSVPETGFFTNQRILDMVAIIGWVLLATALITSGKLEGSLRRAEQQS